MVYLLLWVCNRYRIEEVRKWLLKQSLKHKIFLTKPGKASQRWSWKKKQAFLLPVQANYTPYDGDELPSWSNWTLHQKDCWRFKKLITRNSFPYDNRPTSIADIALDISTKKTITFGIRDELFKLNFMSVYPYGLLLFLMEPDPAVHGYHKIRHNCNHVSSATSVAARVTPIRNRGLPDAYSWTYHRAYASLLVFTADYWWLKVKNDLTRLLKWWRINPSREEVQTFNTKHFKKLCQQVTFFMV